MDPNLDGLMAISITSTRLPQRSRLIYIIVNRGISIEHLLRACPLLKHLRARIPSKIRQSLIKDLPTISTAVHGNLPCLEITLTFMPRCLPKPRTDLRPMIERTDPPKWRELQPIEISVLPPLRVEDSPRELTRDDMVRLCDIAFRMLEQQIKDYISRKLTFEKLDQVRKGWPLGDDPHWDLDISTLLYERINQLWNCAVNLGIDNNSIRGDLEKLKNNLFQYREVMREKLIPPRRMNILEEDLRVLERINSTIF
jgi:hypothetical protein